jgi:hypothetical protein
MKAIPKHMTRTLASAPVLLLAVGCHAPMLRENILSSINSGVGVTINPNAQTQIPEFKAGFVRSQLYSIPTGKIVPGDRTAGISEAKGNASDAPELVSGIRAKSSWENLFIGFEVSESFAVGRHAVQSDAATAMYIADASSDKKAEAAKTAVIAQATAKELAHKYDESVKEASGVVLIALFPNDGTVLDEAALRKALKGTDLESDIETIKKYSKEEIKGKLADEWSDWTLKFKANLAKTN